VVEKLVFSLVPEGGPGENFRQLIDPSTDLAIPGIDDVVITTAREEVFYLSDVGAG
jgi:hypothetical protein